MGLTMTNKLDYISTANYPVEIRIYTSIHIK